MTKSIMTSKKGTSGVLYDGDPSSCNHHHDQENGPACWVSALHRLLLKRNNLNVPPKLLNNGMNQLNGCFMVFFLKKRL